MKIQITLEVESLEAIRLILRMGSDYSLYDYKIINHKILSDYPEKSDKKRKEI